MSDDAPTALHGSELIYAQSAATPGAQMAPLGEGWKEEEEEEESFEA